MTIVTKHVTSKIVALIMGTSLKNYYFWVGTAPLILAPVKGLGDMCG